MGSGKLSQWSGRWVGYAPQIKRGLRRALQHQELGRKQSTWTSHTQTVGVSVVVTTLKMV